MCLYEFNWCSLVQGAVGSVLVVINPPVFNLGLSISQIMVQLFVQTLVPKFAVKGFYKAVLLGLSGLNERKLDLMLISPSIKSHAGKLRAIVAYKNFRQRARFSQEIKEIGHCLATDRPGDQDSR